MVCLFALLFVMPCFDVCFCIVCFDGCVVYCVALFVLCVYCVFFVSVVCGLYYGCEWSLLYCLLLYGLFCNV